MKLSVPKHIMSILPYKPGKPIEELEREYGIKKSVKLASNENPLGPSPFAVNAVKQYLEYTNRYPDGSGFILTEKLSKRLKVKPENIVIGNGSDDIIALLAHGFLKLDHEAVMPFPSFLMYEISVQSAGGISVTVPLKDFSIDFDAIIRSITEKTSLIFLTNPNNPTGSHFSEDDFSGFIKQVPEDVIVIVDEAYIEFARDKKIFNALKDPLSDPRIVCLRTFSKAYGLAGFRVGYGIMDREIAEIIHRIRQPFNVNSLAQVAATAALDDSAFLEKTVALVHRGLDFLTTELTKMSLKTFPTEANFLIVDIGRDALIVSKDMLKHGIIVRSMESYGLNTCIRVNTGLASENTAFINALKAVLK